LGYQKGVIITSPWFKSVDKLSSLRGYYTDKEGIFKISPEAADIVAERIKESAPDCNQAGEVPEIFSLACESKKITTGQINNEFSRAYFRILKKQSRSPLEEAYLSYVTRPINHQGFRSIEFKKMPTSAKKVLLLGDSFTWGHTTQNKSDAFADILLARGYTVYNAVITGADSAQYLALAKTLIPELKPDVVIVNFFLGNDVSYFKRELVPGLPIFFCTNAGNLYSFNDGISFQNKESAYEFILRNFSIPKENNTFNYLMAQSRITTLIWKILYNARKVGLRNKIDQELWKKADSLRYPEPYSNVEMKEIKKIADQYKSKLFIISIPDYLDPNYNRTTKSFYGLFQNIEYFDSPISADLYNKKDGHFNDYGHLAFADFLQTLIER
jgi:lysophospholipase L1-like esterase